MTMASEPREALFHSLLDNQDYHIEFNGFLSNHLKHGIIALHGLNATPERVKEFTEYYIEQTAYGFGLEPSKKPEHVVSEDDWKDLFGLHSNFTGYCDFFEKREKELGLQKMLEMYIPPLLPGVAGSLTHSMIHLGWALDSKNRWMIIEGLAYCAFSFVSCHPDRSAPDLPQSSVLESFLHLSQKWEEDNLKDWVQSVAQDPKYQPGNGFQPVLANTGLQYKIAKVLEEGHPLLRGTPAWIAEATEEELPAIFEQLYYACTLLYMAHAKNFVFLHVLTSLWGIEHIAGEVPFEDKKLALKCFWRAILATAFATDVGIPASKTLTELNQKFHGAVDGTDSEVNTEAWDSIVGRAVLEIEEHNPKLVYVMKRAWERFGRLSIYREAAAQFTITPLVRKNQAFSS